jgi:hypothetical protein
MVQRSSFAAADMCHSTETGNGRKYGEIPSQSKTSKKTEKC